MCVTGLLPGGLCVRYSVRIIIVVRVKYSDDPSWKHVEFCRIVEDVLLGCGDGGCFNTRAKQYIL